MTLVLISAALAQDITVNVQEHPGIDAESFEADLSSTIEDELRLLDQGEYLQDMATAALMSSKGMGVDYASNPERFVLGGSVGASASSGLRIGETEQALPQGGVAVQATAMAGLNLGAFAPDDSPARRFVVYANGMAADRTGDQYESEFMNAGGHIQVKLVTPRGAENGAGQWGGIDLTTGYEMSQYELSVTSGMPVWSGKTSWDATGEYRIRSTAQSIPVELSTNVRLGILSLYAGGGYDLWRAGSSASFIELDGAVSTKVQGQRTDVGTASLSYAQAATLSDAYGARGFFGLQMNVFAVKAYAHVNVQPEAGFGGHAGMRVAL